MKSVRHEWVIVDVYPFAGERLMGEVLREKEYKFCCAMIFSGNVHLLRLIHAGDDTNEQSTPQKVYIGIPGYRLTSAQKYSSWRKIFIGSNLQNGIPYLIS